MKSVFLVLGVVWLILLIRLLSSDGGLAEYLALESRQQEIQTKVNALEAQNSALKVDVQRLQTDDEAIESIARQKLGMIAKDEVFVKVIELKPDANSALNEPSMSSSPVAPLAADASNNAETKP